MIKIQKVLLFANFAILLSLGFRVMCDPPEQGREWADAGKNFKHEEVLKQWPEGTRHDRAFVPMRDGVTLATEIFLPPGAGPFPSILLRTPYGRQQGARYANQYKDAGCVFIVQDTRGRGDSKGKIELPSENEINDGYDTLEWIVKQPWSNGRIGMTGGSGHGMAARMAFLSKHPALVVVGAGNTAGNTYLYWSFENGVRRWMHGWCHSFRNVPRGKLLPTLPPQYDLQKWRETLAAAAEGNKTVLFVDDGWYNCFGDGGAVDDFMAFAVKSRVYGNVDAKNHQGRKMKFGVNFPHRPVPKSSPVGSFLDILKGSGKADAPSRLHYYVMGDVNDDKAPGNVWRSTAAWPPMGSTPRKFFLTADGVISTNPPKDNSASLSYTYDPRDPAPSIGGAYTYAGQTEADSAGALDQRPLHGRKDVLRFYSQALDKPLEIAGKLSAELYFQTDVPDTTLVVKLVDVYPDGQEVILREGAAMARFRNGLDKPQPLEKDKIAKLAFEFSSTAVSFNKGHRIGVFITSSSVPAYEAHPNVWEPVSSYDNANIANIKLLLSDKFPSSITLPVMP